MWQFFKKYTTSCVTAGIESIGGITNKLIVYPNPFENTFNLMNKTENDIISMINYCGQVIWTGSNIEGQDFSYLPNGLYLLRMRDRSVAVIKQ